MNNNNRRVPKQYEKSVLTPEQQTAKLLKRALTNLQFLITELKTPINYDAPQHETNRIKVLISRIERYNRRHVSTTDLRDPHKRFVSPFPEYAIKRDD